MAPRTVTVSGHAVASDARSVSLTDAQPAFRMQLTPVDLQGISALEDLRYLGLEKTDVRDLGPVGELDTLQRLRLSRSPVVDLSPLASLGRLEELWIDGTQVERKGMGLGAWLHSQARALASLVAGLAESSVDAAAWKM